MTPFAQAGAKLLANGYSPIPIMPGTKVPGKYVAGAWSFYSGWNLYCKNPPSDLHVRNWSNWPDAGVCVACGFNNLIAVDIDRDDLVDPILAVLPPVLVAKRGRKGLTAFFRTDEQLPSTNYKDADKQGLLDFLSGGKQTVIPGTIHPDTGQPYEWTTERTLLNTPLESLPLFTDAHRKAMERVLREHGWDAPEPATARSEAVVERPVRASSEPRRDDDGFDAIATARRGEWLPKLGLHNLRPVSGGWRSVASFRESGSGTPLHERDLNLSIRDDGPIVDHVTGKGYNDATLVAECRGISTAEAYAWLRDQLGLTDVPVPAQEVHATYADQSVPFDIGVQKLREAIAGFETVTREWRESQHATKKLLVTPNPPVNVIRIGTSAGKTHETASKIATWLPRGYRIAVAVPDHKMARQVAETIGAHGVSVEIYRGYTQPDPLAPEHEMCRNLPAYKAACDLGVGIRRAVCDRRSDDGLLEHHRCHAINFCGHERQRDLKPDVWVVTHATLLYARPDFIAELDGLVIDEKFFDKTIGKSQPESDDDEKSQPNADEKKLISKPQLVDVVVVRNSKVEEIYDEEERVFLKKMRSRLADAVLSNGDGYLSLRAARGAGISTEDAAKAKWLEKSRLSSTALTPGMSAPQMEKQVDRHKASNKQARVLAAIWEEIETLLDRARELSGRLKVAGSKVNVTQHRPVHPSWHAPTLALDATAASPEILQQALFGDSAWRPCRVTVTDIAIERPYYVHVRQVFGAPVTKGKLGLLDDGKPRNIRAIMRYIRWCAALTAPGEIGLISHKQFIEEIKADLPANVTKLLHFGALSGRNDMERVAGMILIGRPWVPPTVVEADAAVLTGIPVQHVARYERPPGGVRMSDGSIVAEHVERHPHPIAEEIRWQVSEAGVEQARGRLRDLRRKESCWMDVLNDIVLPGTVNEVVDWKKDVKPGAECDMAAEGVVLTNSRDIMKAFGASKDDAEAVGNCPAFSIESLYRKSRAVIFNGAIEKRTPFSPVKFTYRKKRTRGPASTGYLLPFILPEAVLHRWLEERLDREVSLEFERRTVWMGSVVEREPAGVPLGDLLGLVKDCFGGPDEPMLGQARNSAQQSGYEPRRVCRRLQLLRGWSHDKQDDEQVFA